MIISISMTNCEIFKKLYFLSISLFQYIKNNFIVRYKNNCCTLLRFAGQFSKAGRCDFLQGCTAGILRVTCSPPSRVALFFHHAGAERIREKNTRFSPRVFKTCCMWFLDEVAVKTEPRHGGKEKGRLRSKASLIGS